jgi:phage repressor protein C with HTH and peptisase S24 domain
MTNIGGDIEELKGSQLTESPFAARMKFAAPDLSQAEIARRSGVPKSNINKYFAGFQPPIGALIAIAKAFEVDPVWLGTGEGFWKPNSDQLVEVPRYDVQLAAGAGAWQDRATIKGTLVFSSKFLKKLGSPKGDGLIILDVTGDSMDPTIRDGATALIDTRPSGYSDGIWAFALGDALRIKRLRRGLTKLSVISDNPAYPIEEITEHEESQLNLIGRVRWVGQTL